MRILKIILPLFLAWTITACDINNGGGDSANCLHNPDIKCEKVSLFFGDNDMMLNIVLPQDRSADSTPVIVYLPGGAWNIHDRHEVWEDLNFGPAFNQTFTRKALNKGMGVAVIDYHKVENDNVDNATLIGDITDAIDYLADSAAAWHFAPDQFTIGGESAGGHLSLLYASTQQDPRLSGVFNYIGPCDLTNDSVLNSLYIFKQTAGGVERNFLDWAQMMAGYSPLIDTLPVTPVTFAGLPDNLQTAFTAVSPIHLLNADLPPVMLCYGDKDNVIYEGSFTDYFAALSQVSGRDSSRDEIRRLANGGHVPLGWLNNAPAKDAIINWLDEKVY